MDPYETLDLTPDASSQEVREAYKRLVRMFHPDRHAQASAVVQEFALKRMTDINLAFDILTDARTRAQHERVQRTRRRADGHRRASNDDREDGDRPSTASDPDFDYRARATSEFTVRRTSPSDFSTWTAGGRSSRVTPPDPLERILSDREFARLVSQRLSLAERWRFTRQLWRYRTRRWLGP